LKSLNIGVANRDGLLAHLNLKELKSAGLSAIELYVHADLSDFGSIEGRIHDAQEHGLETTIHLTRSLEGKLTPALRRYYQVLPNGTFVIHPVEEGDVRVNKTLKTLALCQQVMPTDVSVCLENLPYDRELPSRFGDNLADVAAIAEQTNVHNCLDFGHYLTSFDSPLFAPLSPYVTHHVRHIHIHAYVNSQDHRPLFEDDGRLKEAVQEFCRLRPDYDRIWSIEILPFGYSPQLAVLHGIEWLQKRLG
jgi:sugar phosphate isomerase/epimerase